MQMLCSTPLSKLPCARRRRRPRLRAALRRGGGGVCELCCARAVGASASCAAHGRWGRRRVALRTGGGGVSCATQGVRR